MNVIRGLLFNLFYSASVIVFGVFINLLAPVVSLAQRRKLLRWWPVMILYLLRSLCGIRVQVEGRENIPDYPVVIMSNHQSTWETIAFADLLWPLCTVLKKELTYIPVFGWSLSWAQPIVIDRSKKATALKEILRQGKNRLNNGLSVLIFPEGTRVPPHENRAHMPGGAMLAVKSGKPILPVVHNAGYHWPAHQVKKVPGVIKVKIGAPIAPEGYSPKQLNHIVENWLNTEKNKLMADS